jgi:hypothetical protein
MPLPVGLRQRPSGEAVMVGEPEDEHHAVIWRIYSCLGAPDLRSAAESPRETRNSPDASQHQLRRALAQNLDLPSNAFKPSASIIVGLSVHHRRINSSVS